jgi:hypothetical protein
MAIGAAIVTPGIFRILFNCPSVMPPLILLIKFGLTNPWVRSR